MKMEEYREVYDQMMISREADERILRELLEERGGSGEPEVSACGLGKNGRLSGKRRGKVIFAGTAFLTAAAAVAVFFAAGGASLWRQKPSGNRSGTEMAVEENRASEVPDGDVKGDVKDSGEPKNFQVQPVSYPVYGDDPLEVDLPEIREGYLKNLLPFYKKTFQKMLTGKKGKNQVCSPVNIYFTMAMLSEMTGGASREQIMEALGQKDGEEIRRQSRKIWQWLYYSDNKDSHCILGNSLWTRQGDSLKKDTLKSLSDYYYASTYQGQMGSTAYDQTIQKWLNKMTGGNLKDSVKKIKTAGDTALVLLSAADFYGTWIDNAFDKKDTRKGTFYANSGKKLTCDFMRTSGDHSFFEEKRFTATSLGLSGGQRMYIFLPETDSSVEELIQKDIDNILHICSTGMEEEESYIVNLKLPKFKIKGERNLISAMKSMGVTDIFDQGSADFTGLLEGKNGCYVDKATQAMQINVDEAGCSISAYSEFVGLDKGPAPSKKKTMTCNRPFLIVISDRNGMPIFAGVVNQP